MAGLTRFFNSREDNETRRHSFHRWPLRPALQSNSLPANADVIAQFGIPSKAQPTPCRAWEVYLPTYRVAV